MDRRTRITSLVKSIGYRVGGYGTYHRAANRRRLTVAMFHRVLPPDDPRWPGSNPAYTVSETLFRDCLEFFRRHYHPVSIDDLLGGEVLPERSLLVTIDDGWADTVEYAAPLLRQAGVPGVVFVAAGAVGRREAFWQERLYAAWRTGRTAIGELESAAGLAARPVAGAGGEAAGDARLRAVIAALDEADDSLRAELIERLIGPEPAGPAQMASAAQLRAAAQGALAIGVHGFSHTPLTRVDAAEELRRASAVLGQVLDGTPMPALAALSFPHGRYDAQAAAAARANGVRLLFTSDPVLTPLNAHGVPDGDLIGRVSIEAGRIADAGGRLDPGRLAHLLFTLPVRSLAGAA